MAWRLRGAPGKLRREQTGETSQTAPEGTTNSRDYTAVHRGAAPRMSVLQTVCPSLSPAKGPGPGERASLSEVGRKKKDGTEGPLEVVCSHSRGQVPGSSVPPRLHSKGMPPKEIRVPLERGNG